MELNISIEWWNNDKEEIEETYKEELKRHALAVIYEKAFLEEYTSGELNAEIEETYYNGWWAIR